MLRARHLDHIVLHVADAERSLAWYTQRLGLEPVRADEWRRGEAPFLSVRVDEATIIDIVQGDGQAFDHFCLVVEPADLAAAATSGEFDVISGPAARYGARGDGTAIYVRDPDGHTVELRTYP